MLQNQQITDKLKTLADTIDVHPGSARATVGYGANEQYTLEFSGTKGSLFDISKIVDHLESAGLIKGNVPDLEAMFYETAPKKPFRIGDNLQATVNDNGHFQLNFTQTKPTSETLDGLDAAIESARTAIRIRQEESGAWTERVRKDDELDRTAKPVFNPKEDVRVVSAYLAARVEEAFPGSSPRVDYKEIGITGKPEFDVRLNHTPGESLASFNDFHSGLGKVFDGVVAVMPHMGGSNTDSKIGFSIKGNPARLIGDIKRNDPDNLPPAQIKVG